MPSPEDIDAAVEAWFSVSEYMIYSYQKIPSCELLQCTRFYSDFQYILQLVLFFSILLWIIDKWQNWKLYWKIEVILRYTENQYQSPYVCQVNKTAQNPLSGWKPPIYHFCILDIFCTRHPQDANLASASMPRPCSSCLYTLFWVNMAYSLRDDTTP